MFYHPLTAPYNKSVMPVTVGFSHGVRVVVRTVPRPSFTMVSLLQDKGLPVSHPQNKFKQF